MRVDGATAVSLQAPPENGNRDEQGGCENAEPGVKRREWLPAAEEEHGYWAREKAHADEHDRGFREAQMGAEQVGCPRFSSESRAPQTQASSQRERHDPEARDHPQGMHVGVELEQRVSRGGVQSLHLVDGVRGKADQQRVEGALQVIGVAGLESQHHSKGLLSDLGI